MLRTPKMNPRIICSALNRGYFLLIARYADPVLFALPKASFTLAEAMHVMVDGESCSEITPLPENPVLTNLVKSLARYLGAADVGITRLRPEHIYSHVGRGRVNMDRPLFWITRCDCVHSGNGL